MDQSLGETADFQEPRRLGAPSMPAKIGSYTIKHALATGGMGTVYLAVQEHPRRTVALKVMKSGVSSPSALRRFEYESQILARLRHPNIAQVFEAGTHDDGSGGVVPYFVMEYIPNAKSITKYACDAGLDVRQRLELFVTVCEAVAHGHQKGVIHRDLKPPNIVVDSSGMPKVIDFGLARATDSDMAVTTLQTDVGELIGTLQYMSPEQCEADPHDLDTRSDVYSLGVVLYELVCEQLPYDLGNLAIFEAVRVIRETSPPRPSAINRTLRGDIETIALKALHKDRARRYRSAAELGEDIGRFLRHEPILARRPTISYQTRVFVRRNRVVVGVVGFGLVLVVLAAIGGQLALFIGLAIGIGGITSGFIRATKAARDASRQRDDAVRARMEAEAGRQRAIEAERAADRQRAEAEKARHAAELEAKKNHAINQFLIHDMLTCASPTEARGREITVREVLENAARQIETAFTDQPEICASLRNTIGMVFQSLGRYTDALPHLRAALKMRRALLGDGHPDVAASLGGLGRLLYEIGDFEDAEPMMRESLEIRRIILGDDHPDVAAALSHLGSLLRAMEDWDEAVKMLMEALHLSQRIYGHQHPRVATNLIRLARLWEARKDLASAERLYRQALEMQRAVLGEDHLHVAVTLDNLANLLQHQHRFSDAEPFQREAVSIFRTRLGDRHQNVLVSMTRWARMLMAVGNRSRAEQVYLELIPLVHGAPADAPWSLPNVRLRYGECLLKQGRPDDAERELLEAHTVFAQTNRTDRKSGQRVIRRLVELYTDSGRDKCAAEYRALLSAKTTVS